METNQRRITETRCVLMLNLRYFAIIRSVWPVCEMPYFFQKAVVHVNFFERCF